MKTKAIWVWFKGLVATFVTWLISMVIPLAPFLIFTIILVLFDLWTGTKAARKRGEQLHSKGFRRTIEKIKTYFIVIFLAKGLMEVFFVPKGIEFDLVYIVSGLIALSEAKSIFENAYTITGVDFWKQIGDKLFSIMDVIKGNGKGN